MKIYLVYGYNDECNSNDVLCVTRSKQIAEEIIRDYKSIDEDTILPTYDGYFIEEMELVT